MIKSFFTKTLLLLGLCLVPLITLSAELDRHLQEMIQDKILRARVYESPFPFVIIEDFLPEALFEQVLKNFPDDQLLQKYGVQFVQGRKILPIKEGVSSQFWLHFSELMDAIRPSIIDKFIGCIDVKFQVSDPIECNRIKETIQFANREEIFEGLYIQKKGQLKPHFDPLKKFVQMIIYLPEDNDHQHLGTVFYQGSAGANLSDKFKHNDDLVPILTVPYKRNVCVMFLQSPLSWHAAANDNDDYTRRAYLTSVDLDPEWARTYYGDVPIE